MPDGGASRLGVCGCSLTNVRGVLGALPLRPAWFISETFATLLFFFFLISIWGAAFVASASFVVNDKKKKRREGKEF
jgi:hypothetical protein